MCVIAVEVTYTKMDILSGTTDLEYSTVATFNRAFIMCHEVGAGVSLNSHNILVR